VRLEVGRHGDALDRRLLGADPRRILAQMLTKQTVTALMPGLMTEAHRRANGESDNITVVAMTWENQDDARVADTQTPGRRAVRRPPPTHQPLDGVARLDDVTDDDIERAIAEIQNAIKKVPR
jgi:hypothetical protein